MRPPAPLSCHEWAERDRYVAQGTSPDAGRWKSAPHQIEVLEAISDPANESVVFIGCSQFAGKTEIVLCTSGYFVAHDPAPQLLVEPTVDMAEALSADRWATMASESPALRDLVSDPKSRSSSNTIKHKQYPGGDAAFVGANSAAGLAMRPRRVVIFDEVDRYPPSAGTEGDPIKIGEVRASAYWNRLFLYVTSPGRKEGRSWQLWQRSDRSEFYVDCPECSHAQILRWSQVKWDKDEGDGEPIPESARYVCERCGGQWDDVARWRAIRRTGRYVATNKTRTRRRGFRFPAMASTRCELSMLVEEWYEIQGNPEKRKVFTNTRLCEWWEERYEVVDETGLLARREAYAAPVVSEVALLTAGVDVQDNRFEVSVWGWGSGEESWVVDHSVLWGDLSTDAPWEDLDRYLRQAWERESGGVDFIRAACVDTGGHYTQSVYDWCAPRFRLPTPDGGRAFVFAIKGDHGDGEVWPRAASTNVPKVPLWRIRVDTAIEQVYGRLSIAQPGPGYIHFRDTLDDAYFRGLTALKVTTRINRRGFPERYWQARRPGLRDEAADCAKYAYAALCGLRANGFDLEAEVAGLRHRAIYTPQGEPAAPPAKGSGATTTETSRESRQRRRGYVDAPEDWLRRRR